MRDIAEVISVYMYQNGVREREKERERDREREREKDKIRMSKNNKMNI